MPQDRISLTLPAAKLAAVDSAMAALETNLVELVALEMKERMRLPKMGGKSEAFCRQTLSAIAQNPQIVNPSLGLASAQADLAALDALRPRRQRLQRLLERMQDTETLLGSDVLATALEAYGLLKVSGKSQGLASLRQGLSTRFKGQGRRASVASAASAANDANGNTGKVA
jgi:hypothetical protein